MHNKHGASPTIIPTGYTTRNQHTVVPCLEYNEVSGHLWPTDISPLELLIRIRKRSLKISYDKPGTFDKYDEMHTMISVYQGL